MEVTSLTNLLLFKRENPELWNSYNNLFSTETKTVAVKKDLFFFCDGYLFLLQDPEKRANLVVQRIGKASYPIVKHIFFLLGVLKNIGIEFIQFNGKKARYVHFVATLQKICRQANAELALLECGEDNGYTYYVLNICEPLLSHLAELTKSIPYYYKDGVNDE